MEGNPCKSAVYAEEVPRGGQCGVELAELVVDRDADGLEHALGRVAAAEARGRGDGVDHDLDELVRRLQRRRGTSASDGARDRPRVALLAVVAEQRGQPALVPLV